VSRHRGGAGTARGSQAAHPRRGTAGAVRTNTIERFRSLIKRGCVRTFHQGRQKGVPLYVAEFAGFMGKQGQTKRGGNPVLSQWAGFGCAIEVFLFARQLRNFGAQ
jgi:hypothetical protein